MSCCPECSEIVIDEGNPLYVICSGEDCPMHYIPKNESLLDEVLSYCTSLDEYYENLFSMYIPISFLFATSATLGTCIVMLMI